LKTFGTKHALNGKELNPAWLFVSEARAAGCNVRAACQRACACLPAPSLPTRRLLCLSDPRLAVAGPVARGALCSAPELALVCRSCRWSASLLGDKQRQRCRCRWPRRGPRRRLSCLQSGRPDRSGGSEPMMVIVNSSRSNATWPSLRPCPWPCLVLVSGTRAL
jgi:hypothetical protein